MKYPPLFVDGAFKWTGETVKYGVDLAHVYQKLGDERTANNLLQGALNYVHGANRKGNFSYGFLDAEILALLGRPDEALAALEAGVAEGWRSGWWLSLEKSPNLDLIRGHPRFERQVEIIREDMAAQHDSAQRLLGQSS